MGDSILYGNKDGGVMGGTEAAAAGDEAREVRHGDAGKASSMNKPHPVEAS